MPTNSARAQDVFNSAAEIPDPAARALFLAEACGGDLLLKSRVEALLRAHDQPDSLLDAPLVAPPDPVHAPTLAYSTTPNPEVATRTSAGGADHADDEPLTFLTPSVRPDSLGRMGHYEVLEVLGKGGFGIVFRAFDDVLQRVVAVKVMAPQLAATSPARKRFLREARTSAAVRHENVVQVYEVVEHPLPYLAMEFIPGETLQQRLDRTGPLEVMEVVRIGRQIAEGLAAAHGTELIHRDIKPSNVLIEGGPQQRVKITDFGLARAADDASISQSGIIAGTPMYMAPEQALGQKLDQRADLFSLGSVLYQMAAGRPPFRANNTVAVLKRVAEDTPRDIREIIPETPQWLCDIIAKLHAKNPDDRYQSAREVADVLADCEAQLKANSKLKDFSRIPRGKSPARSPRRKRMAMAALLLLLAGALGVATFFGLANVWSRNALLTVEANGANVGLVLTNEQDGNTQNLAQGEFKVVPGFYRVAARSAPDQRIDSILITEGNHTREVSKEGFQLKLNRGDRLALRIRATPVDPRADPKSPTPTGRFALAFDGEKSVVKFPSLKLSEDHALTVEAWTVLEDPVDRRKNYDLICNAQVAGFAMGVPPAKYGGDGRKLGFLMRLKNPNDYVKAWENQPVPRNQLIHLAGVYDGKAEIRFYVNGQLQSRTPAQNVKPSSVPLTLGGNWHGSEEGSRFLGRLYEVRVSRVARYDTDFPPALRWKPDTDTIALYHFDEGEGSVLRDSSGNGYNGEIVGAKWVTADVSPLPPTFRNGIGMEFVIVPKGKSWLGGGKDKLGDQEVEIPADFYLGKYEVTQEEWQKVMGENPSHWSRMGGGMDAVKDVNDADLKRFPVENVSWDQCQIFVAKLNQLEKETGWVYRLPTSEEWEYACRGGPMSHKPESAFRFYFAKPTNALGPEQANFDFELGRTCKVGSYEANRLGLFDMHGNVHEWCDDIYQAGDSSNRAVRGGSFGGRTSEVQAAGRYPHQASDGQAALGLRLARVPSGAPSPKATTPPTVVAPFTDADVQRIAALPAAEQVEEVRKELMRRNPGFDGKLEHKIEGDVVTEFRIVTDEVSDIAPIRVFTALRVLDCNGTYTDKPNGQLEDLTQLEGMNLAGLTRLDLTETKVTDAGMVNFKECKNLTELSVMRTQIGDAGLAHFKDCKALTHLYLAGTKVSDVGMAHFKDCKNLAYLNLGYTRVGDAGLAHFKDCNSLNRLYVSGTKVSDAGLAHFKDCKNLTHMFLDHTQVGDAGLAQLKGMPLRTLVIDHTGITDLSPLQGMPLEEIRLTPKNITRGLDILRDIKSLKTIGIEWNQVWPVAEFWERYDKGEFSTPTAVAPFTDADVARIAALPAAEQVEEVRKELMRRNPGFDGTVGHKIEGGVVTEIKIVTDKVTDIAPIRVWSALRVLDCSGTYTEKSTGLLADLTPLEGMNLADLTHLDINHTKVSDAGLAHFKDCKNLTFLDLAETRVSDTGLFHFKDCKNLTILYLYWTNVGDAGLVHFQDCKDMTRLSLSGTKVSDMGLAHFKNCKKLTHLDLNHTQVGDAGLAHFKGMSLKSLWIDNSGITDLSPLQGMPLEEIRLTPKNIVKGLDMLRDMKSLKTIGIGWRRAWPAAEFWERYDGGMIEPR